MLGVECKLLPGLCMPDRGMFLALGSSAFRNHEAGSRS